MSKECLKESGMSKVEDKVTEFFNTAEAVQVEEGTWYYHEASVESELKSVYEQLEKTNERVKKLEMIAKGLCYTEGTVRGDKAYADWCDYQEQLRKGGE